MTDATLTIRWTCPHCGAVGEFETPWGLNYILHDYPLPPDWRIGPMGPLCPAHEIIVQPAGTAAKQEKV